MDQFRADMQVEGQLSRLSQRFSRSSQPVMHLCKQCQGLRFNKLRSGQPYSHGSLAEVKASAKAGCRLCNLLKDFDPLQPPKFVKLQLYGVRKRLTRREKDYLVEEGDIENIGVRDAIVSSAEEPFYLQLALFTDKDDVAATSIKRRPFIQDFASDTAYSLMKQWIDSCVFHHPGCRSPVISRLPSRVIDVGPLGGRQDPFLFTPPAGFEDSYVALSYCWGLSQAKYFLTKAKAETRRLKFPMDTLPKTLQDAILITRRLGFRYLWIDALCIIQEGDEGKDFLKESGHMHEVYGNATITIAAAAAKNVEEGIFRQFPHNSLMKCQIPYDLADGTMGTATVVSEMPEYGGSRGIAPWNTRAWTLQERILSQRVLLFYEDQLSWECSSTLINANGPLNPRSNHTHDMPGRYSDFVSLKDQQKDSALKLQSKCMKYWKYVVMYYTKRQLSHENDKLNALAGLAELVASKTNDSYVAGLWESDLRAQMAWMPKKGYSDPTNYRAPSWSWASIEGAIEFLVKKTYNWAFDILDVQVVPLTGHYIFGEVESAKLVIKGQLKTFPWTPVNALKMDIGHDWDRSEDYYILKFLNTDLKIYGLVLRKTENENEFRRLKLLDWMPNSPSAYDFEGIAPTTLTLV